MGIDSSDNELITLELVHHFVEVLDRYFGNVCELDLIFNFHKVSTPIQRPSHVPCIDHVVQVQLLLCHVNRLSTKALLHALRVQLPSLGPCLEIIQALACETHKVA